MGTQRAALVLQFFENTFRLQVGRIAGEYRVGADEVFDLFEFPALQRQVLSSASTTRSALFNWP